jgi:hypothetical protein
MEVGNGDQRIGAKNGASGVVCGGGVVWAETENEAEADVEVFDGRIEIV